MISDPFNVFYRLRRSSETPARPHRGAQGGAADQSIWGIAALPAYGC